MARYEPIPEWDDDYDVPDDNDGNSDQTSLLVVRQILQRLIAKKWK